MTAKEILKIAKRMQALSQTGLHYASDDFDKQRYEELRELSVHLASIISSSHIDKIRDIFTFETGFQTPKIDIRSVVLKDGNILLAKEKSDSRWSIPGGFADINVSPTENAEKEVFEETGLIVKSKRLLAIIDTHKHDFPAMEFHYYKVIFLCDLLGGEFIKNIETEQIGFFSFDSLPPLSLMRNTPMVFEIIKKSIQSGDAYFE